MQRHTARIVGVVLLTFTVVGLGVLTAFVLSGFYHASQRAMRRGQLSQFVCAFNGYYSAYGVLPPPLIEKGGYKHSWRVLILPFCEYRGLYEQYSMSEPWNSPCNRSLLKPMPTIYCSPTLTNRDRTTTNYVFIVRSHVRALAAATGKHKVGSELRGTKILLIELPDSDIPWTEPRDLTIGEALLAVRPGTMFVRTDLSVDQVPEDATPDDIRKLFTE